MAILLQGALLVTACTTHRAQPPGPPPPSRGACQQYWDAIEKSLGSSEQAEGRSAPSERELMELLSKAAESAEMQALLRCLSES